MPVNRSLKSRVMNNPSDRNVHRRRCDRSRSRYSRPRLEFLEERTLLNVDMVENSNDSGPNPCGTRLPTPARRHHRV